MTSSLNNLEWDDKVGRVPSIQQLFMPNEIKNQVSPYSNYIKSGSPIEVATLDKLFMLSPNIRFLQNNIWYLLTEALNNNSNSYLKLEKPLINYNNYSQVEKLKLYDFIANSVPTYFRVFQQNNKNFNSQYKNPVMALHELNHRFVMEKVKLLKNINIKQSEVKKGGWPKVLPGKAWETYYPRPNVRPGYKPMNSTQSYYPRTYIDEDSFRDGSYHPEDTILNQPMYESWQPYLKYVQNRYVWDPNMEHGSIPIWQRSMNIRNYDRDNSEGLAYAGAGETVNFQHGFGGQAFKDLQQNSIYENPYDPEQAQYRGYWMSKGK